MSYNLKILRGKMADAYGETAIDSGTHLRWNSAVDLKAEEASGGGGYRGTDTISTGSIMKAHLSERRAGDAHIHSMARGTRKNRRKAFKSMNRRGASFG